MADVIPSSMMPTLLFFFFQAEDGIRDLIVTGVPDVCSSDLPERAIAAPRWTFTAAMLLVEAGLPLLAPPGLEVAPMPVAELAGHAHAILVEDGGLRAACDRSEERRVGKEWGSGGTAGVVEGR